MDVAIQLGSGSCVTDDPSVHDVLIRQRLMPLLKLIGEAQRLSMAFGITNAKSMHQGRPLMESF
jgi:hypothetical protein